MTVLTRAVVGTVSRVTCEAAMVRTDQAAMPAASRRGLSALSASSPTGTSAAAYSTCFRSSMQKGQVAQPSLKMSEDRWQNSVDSTLQLSARVASDMNSRVRWRGAREHRPGV